MAPDVNRLPGSNTDDDDGEHDPGYTSDSSTASSVVTIASAAIPGHFDTRHNRLFHSHGNALPYPLPADTPEVQRLDAMDEALAELVNDSLHFGPIQEVLRYLPGPRRNVVDLCTGYGRWVNEMARNFEHVKFYGVDIVPIATRFPAQNVQFEVQDVTIPLRWRDATIDVVHIKHASLGIRNYAALLQEVARILRPRGLFLSREWARDIYMADGTNVEQHAPGAYQFFRRVNNLMEQRDVLPIGPTIPDLLRHNDGFTEVTEHNYEVVFGNFGDDERRNHLSTLFKNVTIQYGDAMRALFLDSGLDDEEIDEIVNGLVYDVEHVEGLKVIYHTVHARKV